MAFALVVYVAGLYQNVTRFVTSVVDNTSFFGFDLHIPHKMPPKGKKKKNPLNDFYFFMQDMKKVLRREGQDWETMEDLVALCHPRWKLLPEHDKAR